MEYWLQLEIESVDDDLEVIAHDSPVDNWLQDNNPLLSGIPKEQINPYHHEPSVLRVSELKFGQDDQGYYLMDAGEKLSLRSGDRVVYERITYIATITKLASRRSSVIPLDTITHNRQPIDGVSHTATQDSTGFDMLNSHFPAPRYHQEQQQAPHYGDMVRQANMADESTPLEHIEQLFDGDFDHQFIKKRSLFDEGDRCEQTITKGSVKKLKNLIWGTEC